MYKNEVQIINNKKLNHKKKNNNYNPSNIKIIKKELYIRIFCLIINIIISIILISISIYVLVIYNPLWRIFFFLTTWSFCMNLIYILSITIIDFISISCKYYFIIIIIL